MGSDEQLIEVAKFQNTPGWSIDVAVVIKVNIQKLQTEVAINFVHVWRWNQYHCNPNHGRL